MYVSYGKIVEIADSVTKRCLRPHLLPAGTIAYIVKEYGDCKQVTPPGKSTYDQYDEMRLDFREYFLIHDLVNMNLDRKGLMMDTPFKHGERVGIPYVIPFTVKRKPRPRLNEQQGASLRDKAEFAKRKEAMIKALDLALDAVIPYIKHDTESPKPLALMIHYLCSTYERHPRGIITQNRDTTPYVAEIREYVLEGRFCEGTIRAHCNNGEIPRLLLDIRHEISQGGWGEDLPSALQTAIEKPRTRAGAKFATPARKQS